MFRATKKTAPFSGKPVTIPKKFGWGRAVRYFLVSPWFDAAVIFSIPLLVNVMHVASGDPCLPFEGKNKPQEVLQRERVAQKLRQDYVARVLPNLARSAPRYEK